MLSKAGKVALYIIGGLLVVPAAYIIISLSLGFGVLVSWNVVGGVDYLTRLLISNVSHPQTGITRQVINEKPLNTFARGTYSVDLPPGTKLVSYVFMPNGSRFAFIRTTPNDKDLIININGREYGPYARNPIFTPPRGSIKFSRNGKVLALVALQDQPGETLFEESSTEQALETRSLASRETVEYYKSQGELLHRRTGVETLNPIISQSGEKEASVVKKGGCIPFGGCFYRYHVQVKNLKTNEIKKFKQFGGYTDNTNLAFSPNGQHVAYIVSDNLPITEPQKQFVVVDNVDTEERWRIDEYSIAFSADGQYIAYGAYADNKLSWVVEKLSYPN